MLRTAKEVKDRDYKKIFIQANKIDSPCLRKMKRVDFGMENPSTADELSCLQPKEQSFHASSSLKTRERVPHQLVTTCTCKQLKLENIATVARYENENTARIRLRLLWGYL